MSLSIRAESITATDDQSKGVTVLVANKPLTELSVMLQKGQIQESKKGAALLNLVGDEFVSVFKEMGFPYRIDDNMKSWRIIEDGGKFVLFGAVYESVNNAYGFVWVMRFSEEKQMISEFLQIGSNTVIGNKYPPGIVPYTGWRRFSKLMDSMVSDALEYVAWLWYVGLAAVLMGLLSGFIKK